MLTALAMRARHGQTAGVAHLNHLALAVTDTRRSLTFYRDVLGVEGAVRSEPYGFVITTPSGVAFTLFEGTPATDTGEFHFGVSLPDDDAVRTRRDELRAAGVPEIEWCDEDGYVSVKVRDPDGYAVEIAWDEKHPST
jgi:catechol 2,3-dioxygenase-like lactoylglutathione lyase family enzyme